MKKIPVIMAMLLVVALTASSALAQATTKSLSTNYTVQNLSDTETATVQVSYMKQYDGSTPGGNWTAAAENTNFTVDPGSSKVIAQYFDDTLSDGAGAATISADQPVAAIVNQLARGQTPTSGSYTAFSEGAASFYAPFAFKRLVTSVGEISSQLTIMNTGSAATDFEVVFIDGTDGLEEYTHTVTGLPVGESYFYDQSEEQNLPDGWYGSAQVNALGGGSVAVVGNQFSGDHGLLTYPGFAEGYTEWVIPLYLSRLANGFNSVISVQNVSGSSIAAGDISIEFTPDPALGGSSFTISNTTAIADNMSWVVNPRANPDFPVESYGAARITSSANVVAIVNQLVNEPPNSSPSALSYNAIRADQTGQSVQAPLIMSRLDNGYSTVFTVANLTDTAGTCTFTYNGDDGFGSSDVTVTDVTLPAGGSIVHNHRLPPTATNNHDLPAVWYGAGTVECTQPVAGIVNQLQSGASGDPDLSYNAFTVVTQ